MIWKHCNNLYTLNPNEEERKDLIDYYLDKRYKRIFYIVDLMNDITEFIKNISNPVFLTTNKNPITKLYFILVRPNYSPRAIVYGYKQEIRTLLDSYNIPKANIESVKEYRFKLYDAYVRIAAVPNTTIADYVYIPPRGGDFDTSDLIRIAGIENDSIVDGPGFRLTVFMQGCNHHCKGCHNPDTWDYRRGKFITINEIINKIKSNPLLQGITLSGGDPFMQADNCNKLIKAIKEYDTKTNQTHDICIYTGYTIQELLDIIDYFGDDNLLHHKAKNYNTLLHNANYIVDGRFELEHKSAECKFRGSTNQHFYKVTKAEDGKLVFTEQYKLN